VLYIADDVLNMIILFINNVVICYWANFLLETDVNVIEHSNKMLPSSKCELCFERRLT